MGITQLFNRRGIVAAAAALPVALEAERPRHLFSSVGEDLATWTALVAGAGTARISRTEALTVPSVLRSRNLICSTLATLPIASTNAAGQRIDTPLLDQPEAPLGLTRVTTYSRTLEDILLDGAALWLVILRSASGFPTAVQRIDYGQWTQDPTTGVIRVNGREPNPADLIMFTSPNPPILVVGGRAIRALVALESSAARYADEPEASVSWTSVDGIDPPEEDVNRFISFWVAARKQRATAWIPGAFTQVPTSRMTAEELQLGEARSFAISEIARLFGIDSEDLGISTTSRTYQNSVDRKTQMISTTLAPYMLAIEERLSLGDVTPRGQQTKFVVDGFLRNDTKTRYEAHAIGLASGFLTVDEVRAMEDRPPLPAAIP